MNGQKEKQTEGWTDRRINGQKDGRTYGHTDERTNECTYCIQELDAEVFTRLPYRENRDDR